MLINDISNADATCRLLYRRVTNDE